MTALYRKLDDAIVTLAGDVLPDGFDVADDAPHTYQELIVLIDGGHRMKVWSGGTRHTIYGRPEVNYAFRAWHDWWHWRIRAPFTPDGETATCEAQIAHLNRRLGPDAKAEALLKAEIIGQTEYHRWHKRFPDDQRGFVLAYLERPDEALLWPLW